MSTTIIAWLLGIAGVLAAWVARGKQAAAETERTLLEDAIKYAREKNRAVRQVRLKARQELKDNLGDISDDYKFLRKDDD